MIKIRIASALAGFRGKDYEAGAVLEVTQKEADAICSTFQCGYSELDRTGDDLAATGAVIEEEPKLAKAKGGKGIIGVNGKD